MGDAPKASTVLAEYIIECKLRKHALISSVCFLYPPSYFTPLAINERIIIVVMYVYMHFLTPFG